MRISRLFPIWILGLAALTVQAQKRYVSPIDFTVSLAGNFGEPRPNHFHC